MDAAHTTSSKADDKTRRGKRKRRGSTEAREKEEPSTSQSSGLLNDAELSVEISQPSTRLPKRKKRSSRNTAAMNSNQRGNDQLDEDSVLITGEKEVINLETGKPRVVDLTQESNSDSRSFVDLTSVPDSPGDSSPVTVLRVNRIYQGNWNSFDRPSCMYEDLERSSLRSSDEEVLTTDSETRPNEKQDKGSSSVMNSANGVESKKIITCPICMDDDLMLKKRKRQLTSTMCGHVFCDRCIRNAVKMQSKCPTCRKKLTMKQLHPIFL